MKRSLLTLGLLAGLTVAGSVNAQLPSITRTQVLTTGRSFASHHWTAKSSNITESRCQSQYASFDWYQTLSDGTFAGVTPYTDIIVHYPGDFVGLPYNWGGSMSLNEFDDQIAAGWGAGAAASSNLEGGTGCTTGVDCSGFVSQAWGIGYYTTSAIPEIADQITVGAMVPGDVWNAAGYHVGMFTQTLDNGVVEKVESLGNNVNINRHGSYAGVSGFVPRRRQQIAAAEPALPDSGTLESPTVIQPVSTNQGNTANWPSSVYGKYSCDASKSEAGPEVFYQVTFDQPGSFTASIGDDGSADVDVHILAEKNTKSCVARGDATATTTVGCGTYYVVVDTFGDASKAGAFTLTTSFTGSGSSCDAVQGPAKFDPKGKPGDECNSPGTPNSPVFCDVNQGAETCLYGDDSSFCSMPCSNDNDCAGMAGGDGCCSTVGSGANTAKYCYAASFCSGTPGGSSGLSSGSSGASGSSGKGSSGSGDDDDDNGASGDDDDDDDNGASGDDDDDGTGNGKKSSSSSGGCASAPGESSGGTFLLVGLGLAALATRRRRA